MFKNETFYSFKICMIIDCMYNIHTCKYLPTDLHGAEGGQHDVIHVEHDSSVERISLTLILNKHRDGAIVPR